MQVHSRVQNLQQLDKIVQKSEKMVCHHIRIGVFTSACSHPTVCMLLCSPQWVSGSLHLPCDLAPRLALPFLQIAAAVEKAGAQTDQQIKDLLQQKAQQVISKLDLEKALSLDVPPEQIAADAMEQASAQLQAEGDQALNLMPDSQTPLAGSTTQVIYQYTMSSSLMRMCNSGKLLSFSSMQVVMQAARIVLSMRADFNCIVHRQMQSPHFTSKNIAHSHTQIAIWAF